MTKEQMVEKLAEQIIKDAGGDLVDALYLASAMFTDLNRVIEEKIKERKS